MELFVGIGDWTTMLTCHVPDWLIQARDPNTVDHQEQEQQYHI